MCQEMAGMRVNTLFNPFTERSNSQKSETKELLANVRYLSAEKLRQSTNAAGAASLHAGMRQEMLHVCKPE